MADVDFARIKGNLRKMIEQGASEQETDAYIAAEGVTLDQVRSAPDVLAQPQGPAYDGAGIQATGEDMFPLSAVPERMTAGERVGRNLMIGGQGVSRGLTEAAFGVPNLVGAATNVLYSGIDAIGQKTGIGSFPYRYKPVSDSIAEYTYDAAKEAGVPVVDTDKLGFADKLGYNVNRIGTEGLAAGQALYQLARRGGGLANTIDNLTMGAPVKPRPLDSLVQPYVAAPARTMATDAAAGAGAATGLTLSQELMPPSWRQAGGGLVGAATDLASMGIGGIGGGTAAQVSTGTPRYIVSRFRDALPARDINIDPTTGRAFSNREVDMAAQFVQENTVGDPTRVAETIADRTQEFVREGLPVPPVGIISGDTGLETLERGNRVQNPVPFIERDKALRDAAVENVTSVRPENAEPRAFTDNAQAIADTRIEAARQQVEETARRAREAEMAREQEAAPFRPLVDSKATADASQALDTAVVDNTLIPMAGRQRELYAAIDPTGEVRRPVDSIAAAANEVEKAAAELPPALRREVMPEELINDIKGLASKTETQETVSPVLGPDGQPIVRQTEVNTGGPGDVSFASLNRWRPILRGMEDKARASGQYSLADNLRTLKQTIDAEAERLAAEGGEAGMRAQQAIDFSKNEMMPTWSAGPGDPATQLRADFNADPANRTLTPPSQTAGRFLQAEQPEKAQSLFRILEKSQTPAEGAKAARDYLISDMARSGILATTKDSTTVLSASGVRAWRDRWGSVLDGTPQLASVKQEVDALLAKAQRGERLSGDMAAQVKKAEADLGLTEREINNGALGLVLGKSPDKAIAAVFASGDPERSLAEIIKLTKGNDKAALGLKRSVADHLINKVSDVANPGVTDGTQAINFSRLSKEFAKNEKVLAQVFSPEEMNALRRAHKVLEPLVKRGGQATVGSPTAENSETAWRALEIGLKAYYGILKGGGVFRTLKIGLKSAMGTETEDAAKELVSRMWFDPELAGHLLTRDARKVGSPEWNAKLQRLIRYNEASKSLTNEDEEPPQNGPMEITVTPKRN